MATADPAARRRALIILGVCTVVGALLIIVFTRYRETLTDWVVADPADAQRRFTLVFLGSTGLLVAPLLVFGAYLWSFGSRVIRAESFPPPGHRVIADTPSLAGAEAVQRGRTFRYLAIFLALSALALWFLMWRLVGLFANRG
jgi:hypothetical protein